MLLLPSGYGASVLVDDFSLGSVEITTSGAPDPSETSQTLTVFGQSASRSLKVGAGTGLAQAQVTGNVLQFIAEPGTGGSASLAYENFSTDVSATPFLRLDFGSINFSGALAVFLQSTANPPVLGNAPVLLNSATPNALFLDVRGFSGYQDGFLTGVNSVLLAFEGGNGPFFDMKLSRVSFTSEDEYLATIPEPAWMSCAVGGLLGALALRRRLRAR